LRLDFATPVRVLADDAQAYAASAMGVVQAELESLATPVVGTLGGTQPQR
jgi:hypothetical protein